MSLAALPKKLAIITASTRPNRVGPQVVDIVHKIFENTDVKLRPEMEVLDIADYKLPVFDEEVLPANVPAMGELKGEGARKWSAAMKPFDGYVLVSPEYNNGMPGGVKNAIDYLYNEWIGKPALIITYGILGGLKSSEQLAGVLTGMKLRVVPTRPSLGFGGNDMAEIIAEMFPAANQGILGEKSKEKWSGGEVKESVEKGFRELVGLLEEDIVPEAPKH